MTMLLGFFLVLALVGGLVLLVLWLVEHTRATRLRQEADEFRVAAEAQRMELERSLAKLQSQVERLSKWSHVVDADDFSRALAAKGKAVLAEAEESARILIANADDHYQRALAAAKADAKAESAATRERAKAAAAKAEAALASATARAEAMLADADRKAREIAGKAYDALHNADLYERTVVAMKNIIEGYGDAYLKPADSLLDDLADEFGHAEAGQALKAARKRSIQMIKDRAAASCDYVEVNRRRDAEHFVIDAFNGAVDSILSRVKHDNHGTLEQEIRDAFTKVNYGGKAFRNARITDEYLAVRLEELKWAATAQELKRRAQEEQRRIRQQIREEEKARRDFERAQREALREEQMLREAMEQVQAEAQAQMAIATEEQRAQFETQLAELNQRLQEAEERNQRAISMAQQTRRGHVYVISNVGSFGENIYKIGLTRRLEPLDRVKELSDASVPFDFDVHAIIFADDAPALETQLHKHFLLKQVNKVNHRKEYFRAEISEIRREIDALGVEANWTMVADAREYRETLAIERAIENDPVARDQWLNRQLTLELIDEATGIADEAEDCACEGDDGDGEDEALVAVAGT